MSLGPCGLSEGAQAHGTDQVGLPAGVLWNMESRSAGPSRTPAIRGRELDGPRGQLTCPPSGVPTTRSPRFVWAQPLPKEQVPGSMSERGLKTQRGRGSLRFHKCHALALLTGKATEGSNHGDSPVPGYRPPSWPVMAPSLRSPWTARGKLRAEVLGEHSSSWALVTHVRPGPATEHLACGPGEGAAWVPVTPAGEAPGFRSAEDGKAKPGDPASVGKGDRDVATNVLIFHCGR